MRLEIGNFHVSDIVFGDELSFRDGILTINKEEALDFIDTDELLEVTPKNLRIRKKTLDARLRKREKFQ